MTRFLQAWRSLIIVGHNLRSGLRSKLARATRPPCQEKFLWERKCETVLPKVRGCIARYEASWLFQRAQIQSRNARSRNAFAITETELKLIAAPAMIGLSKSPKNG
jgi:hypothetical protein